MFLFCATIPRIPSLSIPSRAFPSILARSVYYSRMSNHPTNVYDFEVTTIDGQAQSMSQFKGSVLLIVNVACQCGFTKANYTQLAELGAKYREQGLRVLLFPSNQFGGQEPGTNEQIKEFATNYSKDFILFDKVQVNGSSALPLFKYLQKECKGFITDAIKWNFTKFLVDRAGKPVARYAPKDEPLSFEDKIMELLQA